MNCKGCGKTIFENDCKKVADWTFCLDCFEDLMTPSEQVIAPAETFHKKESLEQKATANTCKICEKKMDPGTEKKLGIWTLCESCHNDLTFKVEKKPMPQAQDEIQEDTQDDMQEENVIKGRERKNNSQTILCSRCGRTILAVAAKEDGGDAFCPDCFYTAPDGKL